MSESNAAIYARISQDRTGAGLGVERQVEDCRALAETKGLTVTAVHSDNDVSAYSGRRRPGYEALLEDVRSGRVQAVLAWHEDRLHRSPRELEDYIDACRIHETPTYFARAGDLDLTHSSGRMTARIRGAITRQESEHKSERVARAHAQAAARGVWRGGSRPFGWEPRAGGADLVEHEAQIVREASHAILAGASLGGIVADLNRRGVRTSKGNAWTYATLRQMLRRPRNAGFSELNGEIVGKMRDWPPIVSEDVWRGVCAVLDDPTRRRSTSNRVRWMMAGIAVCGRDDCGQPLRSATTGGGDHKRTVYRCTGRGGGHVARDARTLDAHVEGVILGVLAREDWRAALRQVETPAEGIESLVAEANALRARLDEAAESFASGAITRGQLERITGRARESLAQVESRLGQARRGSLLSEFPRGQEPAEIWKGLSMDRKRDIVRELVDVTVLPVGRGGAKYDPEAVRIEWKAD